MVEFAEATFLGALAAEVEADLLGFQGEIEFRFVGSDVAGEGDGVVETETFGRIFDVFGGFFDGIDLLLGITAGFGGQDFETL